MNLTQWSRLNPTFTTTLWMPANFPPLPPWLSSLLASRNVNYGCKSDALRYYVLSSIGGVYLDLDYLPISGDLSFLLGKPCAVTCLSNTSKEGEINNGFIASPRNHPSVVKALEEVRTWWMGRGNAVNVMKGVSCTGFLSVEDVGNLSRAVEVVTPEETIERTGPGMWTRACEGRGVEVRRGHERSEESLKNVFVQ